MNKTDESRLTRRGFTILELLVVISIMAIIATLATGAAIKSVKQGREKRIETQIKGLEIALMNYRAQKNEWPFTLSDLRQDRKDPNRYWAHGADNVNVFKRLYHGGGGESTTVYLDASAYFTQLSGKRMPLRTALNLRRTDAPLGYPLPNDTSKFHFFCVCFSPLTDTVKVTRQGANHTCN